MRRNFVFGNGRTRLNIDFNEVRPYGLIYACNAVYREFKPDFLIAVDKKMVEEISKTDYQLQHEVYTYNNIYKKDFKNFHFIDPNIGWSSGPTALNLASQHNSEHIFIFGFDFEGLNGKLNNVYADTFNYKSRNDKSTYYGNWLKQTETVIKNNPNIKYTRVTVPNFFDTKWSYDNYNQILYEDFRKMMSEWKKIR
jgi:hypothetical protein